MGTLAFPYGFTTELSLPDVRFHDVRTAPFDLYGLYQPQSGKPFLRMPDDVAAATSPSVRSLNRNTAGGRVRFCTDSPYIALHAVMPSFGLMDHFPYSGSAGFDLYVLEGARYYYYATYSPGNNPNAKKVEGVIQFPDRRLRQIMIHFPLYSPVDDLYIGISADAVLDHGCRYRYDKPVVYYGSSITQGGCASRPGNAYQAIISIDCDCDFVNLGFSGSAKGEIAIRSYIAQLDMSVFVMDYDHNAPTTAHLIATHEALYRAVREAQPKLPIVFVSSPDTQHYIHNEGNDKNARRAIIYDTYQRARAAGDTNVHFIDGESLFAGAYHDICTVDGCHPNDAGFVRMADRIGYTVSALL